MTDTFGAAAERPRERLLNHSAAALTDAELLAIILRTGTRELGVVEFSHALLERFGGLRGLLSSCDAKALMAVRGVGQAKACELLTISELSRRALAQSLRERTALGSPDVLKNYCIATIGHQPVECCVVLYLDNQHRLIASEELTRGTLSHTAIYPREVVRAALRHHAAAVILAHNHPSGLCEPSQADVHLTAQVRQALSLVDIRLLDHLIVTANAATSMAQMGKL